MGEVIKPVIKRDDWKCPDCLYFDSEGGDGDGLNGWCRIDPPKLQGYDKEGNDIPSIWPRVSQYDFCGKFHYWSDEE